MADRSYIEQNDASRARAEALVERLTDADLTRELAEGWTVTAVLAHIAFWEEYDRILLQRWQAGLELPAYPDDTTLNEALLPLWRLLPPATAVRYLRDALRALDAALAAADDGAADDLNAKHGPISPGRADHRDEHFTQIERQLAQPVA